MTDTRAVDAFLDRWSFRILCQRCGSCFEMIEPAAALTGMPNFSRLVVLRVPEVCPECKSLAVVPSSPASPQPAAAVEPPEGSESA